MPLYALDDRLWFPPVADAQEDGLLAIGGDLGVKRLLLAYELGIFPWFEGDVPLWWSPDPRFVLFPHHLKISKSMKQLLKRNAFGFTINTAFHDVISQCKKIYRPGQDGTWITTEVVQAYKKLHELGFAHSAEAWQNGQLAGGLYGIKLGKVFFGESMFSLVSNASKYAFISLVQQLTAEGIQLIDCQVYTEHLESLGATMIPRSSFTALLREYIGEPG
ncbi:leucyl/phenylalanyl-tRNA--protein transferase [Panacibacter sp. DH6]|uniref:Leucyl/phenylalanyl-tRNA--protein transferase n=1 Tax=Panacibacter microcysteis TaxID=2793269 RepID=A0A931GZJ4_9BACT|nr:leucyl/phenylalanyl-tRNA--protein transferase [Panacibacter microcysteis]MBG9378257.1 leucyl/phenylalanyl-tRNA--protein transferase [Panacibacter microcysteis]